MQRQALWEASVRDAVVTAYERGDDVDIRRVYGGDLRSLGRTRQELLSLVSAQQDADDARREAADRREFEAWKPARAQSLSGDNTAPPPEEETASRHDREKIKARRESLRESQTKAVERGKLLDDAMDATLRYIKRYGVN